MEIIILGVILFILGVGATIAYDKHKEIKVTAQQNKSERRLRQEQSEREALAKIEELRKHAKSTAKQTKTAIQDTFADMFDTKGTIPSNWTVITTKTTTKNPVSKKRVLKGSIKAGPVKANEVPTETQYIEELFDDVSINSTLTVEELIAKIEKMKKK